MNNIFYWFLFAVVLTGLELIYFRIAHAYKILDHPNDRSLHINPTVRGGGIIFYFSALLYFIITGEPDIWFLLSLTCVALIGFIDDVKSLGSGIRFFIQSLAFAIVFYRTGLFELDILLAITLFIVAVGALNAFNFMDGINGLTGGYALIVLGSLLYVNQSTGIPQSDFIMALMVGVAIFCFFNFRTKAICFAGDVGSLSIGFIIMCLIMKLIITTGNYCFLMLVSVYGIDSVLTIIHRILRRENILKAHRLHLFQVIVYNTKITHVQMSLIYMLVQLLSSGIMIFFLQARIQVQYISSVLMLLLMCVIYMLLKKQLSKLDKA